MSWVKPTSTESRAGVELVSAPGSLISRPTAAPSRRTATTATATTTVLVAVVVPRAGETSSCSASATAQLPGVDAAVGAADPSEASAVPPSIGTASAPGASATNAGGLDTSNCGLSQVAPTSG